MAQVPFKMNLKLLIDKKENKVVFAEAGKEAVDFICSILTLPVGTVTSLLSESEEEEEGMVGCLSNLYQSIQNLNTHYVQPDNHKDTVLKPTVSNATEETSLLLLTNEPNKKPETKQLYKCDCTTVTVTNVYPKICPYCSDYMASKIRYVEGETAPVRVSCKGGFVKGAVTYMVMDDLVISPTSAFTGISYLNDQNFDAKSIEEKVVDLDKAKGLRMLKTSFQSKKVLTEVFLQGQYNKDARKTGELK